MTGEKQDGPVAPHVEVTIKSIHGISCKSDDVHSLPPALQASVAFKGSASSMRVTSFTISGRTGELVVQSSSMELDKEAAAKVPSNDNEYRLLAAFDNPLSGPPPALALRSSSAESSSSASSSQRSSTSSSSSSPHLKIQVPTCRPSVSLSPNMDSIRPDAPTQSESTSGDDDPANPLSEDSSITEPKAPIALEFHVCIESECDGILHEGIAHLLFYGDEHFDVKTLDLPIEWKTSPTTDAKDCSVSFHTDARVRIEIEMANEHPCRKIDLQLSDQLDETKMDGIMNQLRENEALAAVRARAVKLSLRDEAASKFPKVLFCNSGSELGLSFQAFFESIRRCGARRPTSGKRSNRFNILRTTSTMATTIATRESLDI
jgi:hypothetical protein